ncbi:MAG: DEAD/DEAH box helicase [Crocinitomicaceae bacterium]|nr:DEAD/DEAH box helicase [Crocinitomicaceae bacterium]
MKFTDLGIIEPILKSLHAEGYETPTPIQQQAIPILLKGTDLLGCAQTGTGKTAAFSIPILQLLHERGFGQKGKRVLKVLILTPTRELASQIGESIRNYGKGLNLTHAVIFGGVNQNPQIAQMRQGVDIVIATPGRLLDLMNQGYIKLDTIDFFVLDEADRMLDMGFIHDINRILPKLPKKRQSLFFSATMPLSIANLANSILTRPEMVKVDPVSSTAEKVKQEVYHVVKSMKRNLLKHIIESKNMQQVLVFSRTKHGADRITRELAKVNIPASAIHGDKSQGAREKALAQFKDRKIKVLVATDIAARGIDIDSLEWVIEFELPNEPESYVHRIGRTGRAGASGTAISFCDIDERPYLKDIEKLIKFKIKEIAEHPFPINSRDEQEHEANKGKPKPQQNRGGRQQSGGGQRKSGNNSSRTGQGSKSASNSGGAKRSGNNFKPRRPSQGA